MNLVFFGSSLFAIPTLDKIRLSNHRVLAVVTVEDTKKGRHLKVESDVVKQLADRHQILVLQPDDLKKSQFLKNLSDLRADLFVVVSYGKILPKQVLDIPPAGSINLHPSLLPQYRGASPVQKALLDGCKETGVSVSMVTKELDSGDILKQTRVTVKMSEDAPALFDRLSKLGADLVLDAVNDIESGKVVRKPQDTKVASYAHKFKKQDGLIVWEKKAEEIINHVRAMKPWPGTYVQFKGKQLKITKAQLGEKSEKLKASPGQIVAVCKNQSISIQTSKGVVELIEVQLEGKKSVNAYDFTLGQRLTLGDVLL